MDTAQRVSFGELLKRYRVRARLTQEELAEQAGLSARGLSYLERGARRPYRETVRRLADALALGAPERTAFAAAAHAPDDAGAPDALSIGPPPGTQAPPLVGRVRELALLERHLARDGPPVLVLAGEPGIGKTRLLQEAARLAGLARWRVLQGGCQWRGGQEPYAPLLAALDRYLQDQPPRQLRADLDGCAWLVRLLPELATGPIEWASGIKRAATSSASRSSSSRFLSSIAYRYSRSGGCAWPRERGRRQPATWRNAAPSPATLTVSS
jgi:transcriptional regulator with XRE-family HTH domain